MNQPAIAEFTDASIHRGPFGPVLYFTNDGGTPPFMLLLTHVVGWGEVEADGRRQGVSFLLSNGNFIWVKVSLQPLDPGEDPVTNLTDLLWTTFTKET